MSKRSRTGPAGDSFFKASYVLWILHFPTALFSGSHEHSGLSVVRGVYGVLSSTKKNTRGNPAGLCTDAFKAFWSHTQKLFRRKCHKEDGLSEIQHRNKQTCQHYPFNVGHVVRVFGIGTILILHLHSNDGTSFLVLLEKKRRGSLWFLIRRTKILVVLACRKDARVSDGVSSTRTSSQSLQNIIKWLKLQSWHWQLQLTAVPKVKLEDSLLLQQAAVTAQQSSVWIIPTCGQRVKWIVLAWRGTTIGIRWSK